MEFGVEFWSTRVITSVISNNFLTAFISSANMKNKRFQQNNNNDYNP